MTRNADDFYERLKSLDDENQSIRVVKNNALLLPMDHILQLLNTTPVEAWEAARMERRYLPVAKTIAKMTAEPSVRPGRSAITRLFRAMPAEVAERALRIRPEGFIWPIGEQWRALFISSFFAHPAAKNFWLQFVDSATALNGAMQRKNGPVSVWNQYADSPLVPRFGCPAFRSPCKTQTDIITNDEDSFEDPILTKCHTADLISVLLRIVAWHVADIVVTDIWDMVVQCKQTDQVPLESLLPKFDEKASVWSNPTLSALEHLANWCGWQGKELAITYLGKLWAKHTVSGSTEATSRIRVLRNWTQRKKGRPKFSSLIDLANAAVSEKCRFDGIHPNPDGRDAKIQAAILRWAETLTSLLLLLQYRGFSAGEISEVMSTYSVEYRTARRMLGKPMKPKKGDGAASSGSA
ncbi:hypothetical protein HX836_23220 [Pseudomonas yamanorum]|uniref:hypothetical protein n=1 Tax=Pseudomonas yamanorum TaxID=515393 RepID=UPI0015A301AA|nr:hypothetical protein [Pseudomonas yamanorum]NVZ84726.1 hypothetical protein [Pseudomonas yamanorum]